MKSGKIRAAGSRPDLIVDGVRDTSPKAVVSRAWRRPVPLEPEVQPGEVAVSSRSTLATLQSGLACARPKFHLLELTDPGILRAEVMQPHRLIPAPFLAPVHRPDAHFA